MRDDYFARDPRCPYHEPSMNPIDPPSWPEVYAVIYEGACHVGTMRSLFEQFSHYYNLHVTCLDGFCEDKARSRDRKIVLCDFTDFYEYDVYEVENYDA